MPSELVNGVRDLLAQREEDGRRVTAAERAMLLATLARYDKGGQDAVDELEAAIAHARRVCLTEPHPSADPALVERARRDAVRRLLAASRGLLDFTPTDPPEHDDDTATPALAGTTTADRPPFRADVDG